MASEYWKANKSIYDTVMALVGKNHPDLALVVEEIAVVFREKASKSGGQVVLGASKKVSPMVNALAGENYKFVLELAADEWESNLTAKQREALLDHLLCSCRCEEDEKSGATKYFIAKPDVSAFRDNVERYGMWFPKPDDDSGEGETTEIFGEDEGE